MIILISLVVMIVIGAFFLNRSTSCADWQDMTGTIMLAIGVILLIVALIAIPLRRISVMAGIERYKALQETLDNAREYGNEYEKATVVNSIIGMNKDIREKQYWNKTIFDIFIPDEIDKLELIK